VTHRTESRRDQREQARVLQRIDLQRKRKSTVTDPRNLPDDLSPLTQAKVSASKKVDADLAAGSTLKEALAAQERAIAEADKRQPNPNE
jgi:hypothetical protein